MARVKGNILTTGISGTINKQIIFKQYGENTVVSNYPDMSKVVPSAKQKAEKTRFALAMDFASQQMKDPALKAAYKAKAKGMQRAHNVAVKDYYNKPTIEEIILNGFSGKIGDTIEIIAFDDFKVAQVTVQFVNEDGEILQSGTAKQQSELNWIFTLSANIQNVAKIIATAKDLPGNSESKIIEV
jgi:hypothetical protein